MTNYPPLYTTDVLNNIEWQITPLFCKTISISFIDENICEELKNISKQSEWLIDDLNSGENGAVSKNRNIIKDDQILEQYFLNHCSSGLRSLGYNKDIQITTSWLTKTNKDGSCLEHTHCNSWYSCVVYFDEYDDQSSKIQFIENSSQILVDPDNYNFLNATKWTIGPNHGMFIMFPSGTRHKVLKAKNSKTRYSLAFNIMPKGETGKFDSSFYY